MIGDILKITDKVFDRLVPDKTKAERIKTEFNKTLLEIAVQERDLIQKFILDYEGRADQVPKFILIMRALIRPVFTWLFGVLGAGWVILQAMGILDKPMPDGLQWWVSITLSFWFGGRVFEKTKGLK